MLPKQLRFLHPYLHFTGLLLMVAGLPFSVFLMSLSQFFIGGNWILEGNYTEKLKRFRGNRNAWLLMGVFLMLIPGMLYTSDTNEGLKLLRLNLPFFIFPFVLASSPPLSFSWYRLLMKLFVMSVFLATITCAIFGLPRWLNGSMPDIRQISLFISHIRFALLIVFSIVLIFWMFTREKEWLSTREKIVSAIIAGWMVAFLFILQSLTGLIILALISGCWAALTVWKTYKPAKAVAIYMIPLLVLTIGILSVVKAYQNYVTPAPEYSETPAALSPGGNPYSHTFSIVENSHFVFANVCDPELRNAWQRRTDYPIDSIDGKGNPVYITLIRFLNSKGLHKDEEGVKHLTENEIRYIQQGIANVNYTGLWGIRMRFYQLLWEIDYYRRDGANASGHSLLMKLEFWRNSVQIIKQHPLTGVGTGDVLSSFKAQYRNSESWLDKRWWMNSHNQFLFITVAAGIPGLVVFLICLLLPAFRGTARNYAPFVLFFSIALISMLTEDTLTTQAGISFVVFFYAFFLFSRPKIATESADSSDSSSATPNPLPAKTSTISPLG